MGKACERADGSRRRAAAAERDKVERELAEREKADRDARDAEARGAAENPDAKEDLDAVAEPYSGPPLDLPVPSRERWKEEIGQLKQLVDSPDTPEDEKVRLLHEALVHRIEDSRGLDEHRALTERRLQELEMEKTRCRTEIQKTLSTKATLEDSCRDLQQKKINIPKETERLLAEEDARRADLEAKMDTAMTDASKKIDAEKEIQEHFAKENEDLQQKLAKFTETCDDQEHQLAEKCETRSSELKVAEETLIQYQGQSVKSKANAIELEKKNKELLKTIPVLRAELRTLLEKFNGSQGQVNECNEQHTECKSELEAVQKQMEELEAENEELRNNAPLAEAQKEQQAVKKQCDALSGLCSTLEKEVDGLRKRLNKPKARGSTSQA